ncbi:decarboxylating NADP(+)-dependent phosphogluconate dehydrogenase [Rhodoferax sp.]|uniref:decarboxylating NADP(+)-dependent phosphogluconate dehydrogenase n=1 Tax=Rhodoferax sp. TaxID=50421 RepID=UPI0025FF024F|nr:decarboxylating NADP(+)-dependent phosphogluconate dehydrogenase [Rhodoferax sp.]
MSSQIGLIGMGVMGGNLALNMVSKNLTVSVYDISAEKLDQFLARHGTQQQILVCRSTAELITSLERPRKIMLMIPAGKAVDEVIDRLLPGLEAGDILIDGGNSHFPDTTRRTRWLESKGLLFVGMGISGGEEGALHGPSLMPGGSFAAWASIKPICQAIAAKVDVNVPCCEWIGGEGSGHLVKMVHNGIEYGDMQLICEVYDLMRKLLQLQSEEMAGIFMRWGRGDLKSYLIDITADILTVKDADGLPLVDKILDQAGQKGTGKWSAVAALDMAVPLTLITESVFARMLSAIKDERMLAAESLSGPQPVFKGDKDHFIEQLGEALLLARIISYAQGYQLMRAAGQEFGWTLNYSGIANLWRGGCIIRSELLGKIRAAFDRNPLLQNILLDPVIQQVVTRSQSALRDVVSLAIQNGIPVPALSAAIAYLDTYRCTKLPANLLQAQRDYFGAHQYQRIDKPVTQHWHTDWLAKSAE